jgi:hypothetical protein
MVKGPPIFDANESLCCVSCEISYVGQLTNVPCKDKIKVTGHIMKKCETTCMQEVYMVQEHNYCSASIMTFAYIINEARNSCCMYMLPSASDPPITRALLTPGPLRSLVWTNIPTIVVQPNVLVPTPCLVVSSHCVAMFGFVLCFPSVLRSTRNRSSSHDRHSTALA